MRFWDWGFGKGRRGCGIFHSLGGERGDREEKARKWGGKKLDFLFREVREDVEWEEGEEEKIEKG